MNKIAPEPITYKSCTEISEVSNIVSENTTDIKSFHYLEDDTVSFSTLSTRYTKNHLESGIYHLGIIERGRGPEILLKRNQDKEKFDTSMEYYFEDRIQTIYNSFFDNSVVDKVHKLGYNHKLGILLYGKQGTGKTSMLKKYFTDIVTTHNGIVFNFDTYGYLETMWEFIQKIRKIQTNPIVCFCDELDEGFIYSDFERTFKIITDGSKSIDNIMFLMATNYIDKIPSTIKDRPSRVKYSIEISGIQDANKIKTFLIENLKKIDIVHEFSDLEINELKGSTIDELKQWLLDKIMNIKDSKITIKKIGFSK